MIHGPYLIGDKYINDHGSTSNHTLDMLSYKPDGFIKYCLKLHLHKAEEWAKEDHVGQYIL